jgi:PKHD-type hydroxylase
MNTSYITTWQFQTDYVERWAFWDKLFTKEECDKIIEICNEFQLSTAKTYDEKSNSLRKSEISFIPANGDTNWFYEKIASASANLNERFFKFDLHGFDEGLQFTRYVAPGGKYEAHVDKIYNYKVRKLSIVVQLTDPTTYEGGQFELIDQNDPESLPKDIGTMLVFPSYSLHRVTPVTEGTRYSLVGWISGKPFK